MKKNELKELHAKTHEELVKMLGEARLIIAQSQMDKSMGKLKNTNFINTKKKDVARMLTLLGQKMEGVKNG